MYRNPTRLKTILQTEGRKQVWLCDLTGIAAPRMSYIVKGLHPTEDEAKAIAKALGRKVSECFESSDVAGKAAA